MENISNSLAVQKIVVLVMLFVAGVGSILCVTVIGFVSVLVHIARHILSNLLGTKSSDNSIE